MWAGTRFYNPESMMIRHADKSDSGNALESVRRGVLTSGTKLLRRRQCLEVNLLPCKQQQCIYVMKRL